MTNVEEKKQAEQTQAMKGALSILNVLVNYPNDLAIGNHWGCIEAAIKELEEALND